MYTMVDSCMIALYIQACSGKHSSGIYAYNTWYPCTKYVHAYTLYVHVYAMYVHVLTRCLNSHSQGIYRRYIPVCTGRFLYDSIVYTYVKGSTGKHAVANTAVVYAYNMWYPCTVYVHVYTLYVHVYAMYVHVLISCLNSHSEGVYRRYIPVCTQWQIPPQQHFIYLCQRLYRVLQASMQWQPQQWYMHTIRGTDVQCMYMYIHCMYTYMQGTYIS